MFETGQGTWRRIERRHEFSPLSCIQSEATAIGQRLVGTRQCALQDELADRTI